MVELQIKGNYKSFIKLKISRSKIKTDKVALIVHGLYADSGNPYSKSKLLGNKILKENIANVVYFSSSRDWSIFPSDGDLEKQQEAFKNKTFTQEVDDLLNSIQVILDQSNKLFGVKKEKLGFYIVANSMGGTVTSMLNTKFNYIDKIVLAGSGIKYGFSNLPILSTVPKESEIIKSAEKFTGNVLSLQGSKDEVVLLVSQNRLLNAYSNAKTTKKIINGANHSFSTIDGKNKVLARNLYINSIINFLCKCPQ